MLSPSPFVSGSIQGGKSMWFRHDGFNNVLTKRSLVFVYAIIGSFIALIRFSQPVWPPNNFSRALVYMLLLLGGIASVLGDWEEATIHRQPLAYIGLVLLIGGLLLAR